MSWHSYDAVMEPTLAVLFYLAALLCGCTIVAYGTDRVIKWWRKSHPTAEMRAKAEHRYPGPAVKYVSLADECDVIDELRVASPVPNRSGDAA